MNCPYCERNTVGHEDVIIVVGKGPAYVPCHQAMLITRRIFKGIPLSALLRSELLDFKEMLLTEIKARESEEL